MNILVIGSGGREDALVWKIRQSPKVAKIFCAPGNAGISRHAECVALKVEDFAGLAAFAVDHKIALTVVGPEVPLAAGIVDFFMAKGLAIFGPDKSAARLEASKAFSKNLMKKCGVRTAAYHTFTKLDDALNLLAAWPQGKKLVVKADGLAAGKGVIICATAAEAVAAVKQIMTDKVFGTAGAEVVIEEFLEGEECSVQVFLDGSSYSIMVSAQDHKRVGDNDQGPNTGGMGTYAPAPVFTPALHRVVETDIMAPLMEGFKKEGITYKGVLYLGLMIVKNVPYVLEFNCRFGDPETQVVLPLLKTDLIDVMTAVVKGTLGSLNVEWHDRAAVCVVLASQGYPGDYPKGKVISGLAKTAPDITVFHAGTAKNATGDIVTAGGRVLGVTGTGSDITAAIRSTYAAVEHISFDGMHYRRDIGRRALDRRK